MVPVNESMQFGFKAVNGTIQGVGLMGYALMSGEYFLSPELGIEIMAGQETQANEIGGGANVFFNIVKNTPENGFRSTLRVQAGYLFDVADGIASGTLNAGLVGTFGM
jgi:hypothetical protein